MSVATACANIALVKYWGKRDAALNTPAAGSLSLTLDRLRTFTEVELTDAPEDRLWLDGAEVTGRKDLSILARRGSGSAARSIFGGVCLMHGGSAPDGQDAYAEPLEGVSLTLSAAVAAAKAEAKKIGSTDGMDLTRDTSPYHAAWIECVNRDLGAAQAALRDGDLSLVAEIVEGNCLAMHANAMAARPGIIYFGPSTLWAIQEVRAMRAEGTPVFFTIDAGPHVVAFTPPEHLAAVAARLRGHPEVAEVITSAAGEGAHLVERMP